MALSKSEIFRDWIKNKLDNNYDYSTMENRTLDFKEFVNSHNEFDIKKDKPLYHYILKKEAKRRGIDPRTLGLKPHKPIYESDMTGTITEAPALVRRMPIVKKEKHELENTDNAESTMTQEQDNFTARSAGLIVKYSYNFLKLIYPLENLTQDEQDELGELWLPMINRCLKSDKAMLFVASFSTLSIIGTKIKDAKQKAKNQNSDDEPDNQESL